jgi:hypothetical protein
MKQLNSGNLQVSTQNILSFASTLNALIPALSLNNSELVNKKIELIKENSLSNYLFYLGNS